MKEGHPAESACNLITKFWHDPSKYGNDLSNDILEKAMIAKDIPELLIDEEQNIEKEKIGQVYNHNEDTSSNIEHSTEVYNHNEGTSSNIENSTEVCDHN